MIACSVNGFGVNLLVDTGSRVTLIRESVLQKVTEANEKSPAVANMSHGPLVGITGEEIDIRGCFLMQFALGEHRFDHACYVVADGPAVPVDGILGQDVLSSQRIDLLTTRKVLRVGENEIPIWNWRTAPATEHGDSVGAGRVTPAGVSVRLASPCTIPAMSEVVCWAKLAKPIAAGELGVVETGPLSVHGLAGASALVHVTENLRVPVRIANFTLEELTLPRNKNVALFHGAELSAEVECVRAVQKTAEAFSDAEIDSLFDIAHVTGEELVELRQVIRRYAGVFARTNLDLGQCGEIKHRINTGDATPVYQRAYRIPYSQREEMDRQVGGMMKAGIVEHSKSPWGSPALLVEKADGSFRFVVDYRKLNSVTRVDPYPLPNIQETLSQLGSARYFSVVDMASGFWQIEMDPTDKEKTAFNTTNGHYQWTRMPMGLVNSPAVWQRTADVVLEGLVGQVCHVYMDDIVIYSETFDQHMKDVESVLRRLRGAGLKLKPKKCQFLKAEVKYLGHMVSAAGVRPDPEKVSSVQSFPRPTNLREVREFLGLIGYYRRHINQFSREAKPLTRLTAKNVKFEWTDDAEGAFQSLKQRLVEAPILRYPDFRIPFVLATDASQYALGAVLSQRHNGHEHPVAFASRQLNKAEQSYSATEKECLALVWAVRHFRCYLYGRDFKITTDCRPLKWLMNMRDPSSRLARWNLQLQEYNFEVEHKAGKAHTNADALSRRTPERDPPAHVKLVTSYVPTISEERLREEQQNDPSLEALLRRLPSEPALQSEYKMNDQGLLCKISQEREGSRRGCLSERFVVPACMVPDVLKAFHNAPYAGHFGEKKTRQKIEKSFFWSDMRKEIKHYCACCESCQLRKTSKQRKRAPLQVFGEVTRPFERTAMDIVGPLPCTADGHRYILMFVDHLTRFAEALPLFDQKAETVARAFVEKIVLKHGVPHQLLTDQGSNFVSGLMTEVCKLLGVERLRTTPYHPEANGAVERLNQTVKGLLSHLVAKDQKDWDVWLPYVMFAYNTATHESTNETPFYLVYGRDPDLPQELLTRPQLPYYGTLENYREELELRLRVSHELAREVSSMAAESRKGQYDKRSADADFEVGERVYLRVEQTGQGLSRKLAPKWKGPYRVVEQLSSVVYRLRCSNGGRGTFTVHANRLKRMMYEGPYPQADGEAPAADRPRTRQVDFQREQPTLPDESPPRSSDREFFEAVEEFERELRRAHLSQEQGSPTANQTEGAPESLEQPQGHAVAIDPNVWELSYTPQ